jgi:hypothetical protein
VASFEVRYQFCLGCGVSSVNNPTKNPCEFITRRIASSFASFVNANLAESGLGDTLEVEYGGNGS